MGTTARGINTSPDIYSREKVLPYSVKSLGVTALGLVGETQIGPAFQPIPISSWVEYTRYFGGTSTEKYATGYPRFELPYIAKSFLTESNQLFVTRVLGLSGFRYNGIWALHVKDTNTGSTINNTVLATLRTKAEYDSNDILIPMVTGITINPITPITGATTDFQLITNKNGGGFETYTVSLDQTKKNYILKVLGNSPNGTTNTKIFVEEMFEGVLDSVKNANNNFNVGITIDISLRDDNHNKYNSSYTPAQTPWFVSEVKGENIIRLFRFITISDGDNANNMFKVSITNINKESMTFNVVIRSINDTDANPIILENFTNCSLDPNSGNKYIGKQIGTIDEVYPTNSKYIIIEIDDNPLVEQSVPMGFVGYEVKKIGNYKPAKIFYNNIPSETIKPKKQYFGLTNNESFTVDSDFFKFNGNGNLNLTMTDGFHMESAAANINVVVGVGVNLKFQTISNINEALVNSNSDLMKYTTYFYGGFDGWDVFRTERTIGNNYQYNEFKRKSVDEIGETSNAPTQFYKFDGSTLNPSLGIPNITDTYGITSDFYAFWSAIRTFANPELADINIFATPGIDTINNSLLVNETLEMLETERKDAIYIVTTPDKPIGELDDSKSSMFIVDDLIEKFGDTGIDSNYAATYFPWVQFFDKDNAKYIYLSPTKDVVRNLALTDNTAAAWFAPAGMTRGVVDCIKAKKNLIIDELNALSNGRINALRTFSKEGVRVFKQNTLQVEDNHLNRIGVRRMMLYLRKTIRRGNLPLIFEPEDNTTKNKFLEIVNPILNAVKSGRGISDYFIDIDDSLEAKAKHEMNVVIGVKPIGALEFINIDFVIADEGFDFNSLN